MTEEDSNSHNFDVLVSSEFSGTLESNLFNNTVKNGTMEKIICTKFIGLICLMGPETFDQNINTLFQILTQKDKNVILTAISILSDALYIYIKVKLFKIN